MMLPFAILWTLVKLLPPVDGREDRGAIRGLTPGSSRAVRPAEGAGEEDRWRIGWRSCRWPFES